MRIARARHEENGMGYYHCISRVVGGQFLLGDAEKERLRELIWKAARFCGVRVLTYCVMSNHFHVLAEVTPVEGLSEEELLDCVAALNGRGAANTLSSVVRNLREQGHEEAAKEQLERHRRRMGDISVFMQEIKQRFTRWYNKRHERYGTLWAERFESVLIENNPQALLTMAAYIDLNPVRAGVAEDPGEYRWSGYTEALAGRKEAREGLALALCEPERGAHWRHTGSEYRKFLYGYGEQMGEGTDPMTGERARRGIKPERVREVLEAGGELSVAELLRVRVRYLSKGYVLGSREWVENFFERHRERFGPRRRRGARKMRGGDWGGLCTTRDLRVDVFSSE